MERIGEKLRKRREELGFTIDDIARATRFRPEMIKAIEDGRVGIFPADAYLKAFLRAYASKLGLNPQEIISEQKSEEERVQEAISGIRVRPRRGGELRKALILTGIIGVAAISTLVLYDRVLKGRYIGAGWQMGESLPVSSGSSEAMVGGDTAGVDGTGVMEDVSWGASDRSAAAAGDADTVSGRPDDARALAEREEVEVPRAPEPEVQDARREVVREPPVSPEPTGPGDDAEHGDVWAEAGTGPDSLEISVSGWSTDVLLVSGDRTLAEGTLRPGYRKTFYSTEAFFFDYITNKDAISLLYNGLPVRLPTSGGRLVADLRIPPQGR